MKENKKKLFRKNCVIDDDWIICESFVQGASEVLRKHLIPFEQMDQYSFPRHQEWGVWVTADLDLENRPDYLLAVPVIAILLSSPEDGRIFTIARMLRQRYHFQGEIRAVGNVPLDQLYYLASCGCDSFALSGDVRLDDIGNYLQPYSENYQENVRRPPLFYRRASLTDQPIMAP